MWHESDHPAPADTICPDLQLDSRLIMARSLPYILRHLVDARTGVINRLTEIASTPLSPNLFVAVAEGRPSSYYINNDPVAWSNSSPGSGAAFSREQSLWAAAGETVERYCTSIYNSAQFHRCVESKLPHRPIKLESNIGYAEEEAQTPNFPFSPYRADVEREWFEGVSLIDGEPIFAPAQMIYLSSGWKHADCINSAVSTGAACHTDPERAIESALLEIFERDSFSSAWLLNHAPRRLVIDESFATQLSWETRAAILNPALPITLQILQNAYNLVTVIATAESPMHGFGVVGAACRRGIVPAVEKAVIEALHGWCSAASSIRQRSVTPDVHSIIHPHDHALHYQSRANWKSVRWFLSPESSVEASSISDASNISVASLLQSMARDGLEASLYDVTTDDMRAIGFFVARVIVPGLQPLLFGQTPIPADRRRLIANAKHWSIVVPATLNSQFHPFP